MRILNMPERMSLIIHVWMTTTMSTGILGWMGYEVAIFLCILSNIDLVAERVRAFSQLHRETGALGGAGSRSAQRRAGGKPLRQ